MGKVEWTVSNVHAIYANCTRPGVVIGFIWPYAF